MKKSYTLLSLFLGIITITAKSQTVFEWGVKPTEWFLMNFETHFAMGTDKHRYGIYFSYRPSFEDSLEISAGGKSSMPAPPKGYGWSNFNNFLYHAYTIGWFYKVYSKKNPTLFYEADMFYRNWHFNRKLLNLVDDGRRTKGIRTENVDVYGLKLLIGKTVLFTGKGKRIKTYVDMYAGIGGRYKTQQYETFNGTVDDVYYDYFKQRSHTISPSIQLGIKWYLLTRRHAH
jgi:hypothetical protein